MDRAGSCTDPLKDPVQGRGAVRVLGITVPTTKECLTRACACGHGAQPGEPPSLGQSPAWELFDADHCDNASIR
eukprot:5990654-Prymnesium_polylepis.1